MINERTAYEVRGGIATSTNVVIPDTFNGLPVTAIANNGFQGFTTMTSITIPNSVITVGQSAFLGCTNLTIFAETESQPAGWHVSWNPLNRPVVWNTVLSESRGLAFTLINERTAYEVRGGIATSINVVVPDTFNDLPVTAIADNGFQGFSSMSSIIIPNSVVTVGSMAFLGCTNLTIYAEAESQPEGWHVGWNPYSRPVVWGYAAPSAVTLLSPEDNAIDLPARPTFEWEQPTGTVSGYRIYLWTGTDEDSLIYAIKIEDNETLTWTPEDDLEYDTTYHWQVVAFNGAGDEVASETWSFTTEEEEETNIHDEILLPVSTTALLGNFPNPFNPSTSIRYQVSSITHVNIEIFNIRGQRIKSLVNEEQRAGEHSITWNGRDDNGNNVASGVYLYRMRAGEYQSTRRMMMIK